MSFRLLAIAATIGLNLAITVLLAWSEEHAYKQESLQGRVVWLGEALERLHGVQVVPEARQRTLALETAEGRLVPLMEDVRGRAFRVDERLMKMRVELLLRFYPQDPVGQIVSVYEIKDDGKYLLDYWCEICAINMVELKPCECCQGEIELRLRKTMP